MLETISIILVMFICMALGAVLMHLWNNRSVTTEENTTGMATLKIDRSTMKEILKAIEDDDDKEDEAE